VGRGDRRLADLGIGADPDGRADLDGRKPAVPDHRAHRALGDRVAARELAHVDEAPAGVGRRAARGELLADHAADDAFHDGLQDLFDRGHR
jgi:hypothetical protein